MQRGPGLDLDGLRASGFQQGLLVWCERFGGHQDEPASGHLVEPAAVGQQGVGAQASGERPPHPRPQDQRGPAQAWCFTVQQPMPQAGDPVRPWRDQLPEQVTRPATLRSSTTPTSLANRIMARACGFRSTW